MTVTTTGVDIELSRVSIDSCCIVFDVIAQNVSSMPLANVYSSLVSAQPGIRQAKHGGITTRKVKPLTPTYTWDIFS